MDFIKRNRKNIEYVLFGLLTIFFFTILIISFTRISDLKELKDSIRELEDQLSGYGDSYLTDTLNLLKEQYSKQITPIVFQIIAMIISTVGSGFGLFFVYKEKEANSIMRILGISLIGLSIYFLTTYGNGIRVFNDLKAEAGEYGSGVKIPGEYVANIIFAVFALVGSLALVVLPEDKLKIKKIIIAVTGFLLFVASAIELSLLEEAEGKEVCASVFELLSSILFCASCILVDEISFIPSVDSKTVVSTSGTAKVTESVKPETDAAQELKKLKSLLDDGIITEEEYNEKRKKYIDQL